MKQGRLYINKEKMKKKKNSHKITHGVKFTIELTQT